MYNVYDKYTYYIYVRAYNILYTRAHVHKYAKRDIRRAPRELNDEKK
jgi:hypothetical protein